MLSLARILMVIGLLIFLLGGALYLAGRLNLPLGRLPGDIRIERDNFTCIFPLATSILLSIILSVVFGLILRLLNK
jgi:hypothetical protein